MQAINWLPANLRLHGAPTAQTVPYKCRNNHCYTAALPSWLAVWAPPF